MIIIGREDEEELFSRIGKKRGSVVAYFGYVREFAHGRKVRGMICGEKRESRELMEKIEKEIMEKFPVERVILYHSVGSLKIGELLAAVLVSSLHRQEAFEACRYGIDRIKELEPVKREEF